MSENRICFRNSSTSLHITILLCHYYEKLLLFLKHLIKLIKMPKFPRDDFRRMGTQNSLTLLFPFLGADFKTKQRRDPNKGVDQSALPMSNIVALDWLLSLPIIHRDPEHFRIANLVTDLPFGVVELILVELFSPTVSFR